MQTRCSLKRQQCHAARKWARSACKGPETADFGNLQRTSKLAPLPGEVGEVGALPSTAACASPGWQDCLCLAGRRPACRVSAFSANSIFNTAKVSVSLTTFCGMRLANPPRLPVSPRRETSTKVVTRLRHCSTSPRGGRTRLTSLAWHWGGGSAHMSS